MKIFFISRKMEDLGSDVIIEIMKNLSGKDILSTCQTSTKLHRICSGERYNKLWQMKLKEELDISYLGGYSYEKYIELSKIYNKKFYLVTYEELDRENELFFFENQEKAIDFIIQRLMKHNKSANYFEVRSNIENRGFYLSQPDGTDGEIYRLRTIKLRKQEDKYKEQHNIYDDLQKRMKEEFPNQKPEFYIDINVILAEMIKKKVKNISEIQIVIRNNTEYSRSGIKSLPQDKLISFLKQEFNIVKNLQLK